MCEAFDVLFITRNTNLSSSVSILAVAKRLSISDGNNKMPWTKTHLTAVNHQKIFLPFILQLISKSTFSIDSIIWQIKILAIKTDSCQGYMIYDLDIFYKDKFSDLHLAQQTLLHKKNTDLQFLYCIVYATITFSLTKLNQ